MSTLSLLGLALLVAGPISDDDRAAQDQNAMLTEREKAMLTEKRVLELAVEEFERHAGPASNYDVTLAPYPGNDEYWMVWFELKGPYPIPGGRHGVRVHKTTGEVLFMRGE